MTTAYDSSTLSAEFHNIIKDVESLLHEASALGGGEYTEVVEKVLSKLATAKTEMSSLGHNISETVHESTAELSAEFRREPLKVIASVAVVGLVAGYLIARR